MKNEFLNTEYIVGVPFEGDSAEETWTRRQSYQAMRDQLAARQAAQQPAQPAAPLTWWQRVTMWLRGGGK